MQDNSPYLAPGISVAANQTIWGIHLEWDSGAAELKEIAIGWDGLGDLNALPATRDAFKAAFVKAYPDEKAGAVPVKAGVLYRFAKEMSAGDLVIYPSKADRQVNIGSIDSAYEYLPTISEQYPHRRKVVWKAHIPRAQFSQPALYEIGSALTLFQVNNNADEFLSIFSGTPWKTVEVDDTSAAEAAVQAEESVEDFIIKRLKSVMTSEQFEYFIADLLRSMGYFTRVSRYSGDGGVDIIAHKDELGFEPPIIKVQCKQTLTPIGGPAVQQLLGAIQQSEHALFVTLGGFTPDAVRIERGKSHLRLVGGSDLVQLILGNYDKLDPRFKSLIPMKRSYVPSGITTDAAAG